MGIATTGIKSIMESPIKSALTSTSTISSTSHRVEHKTIHAPINISIKGVTDPEKAADIAIRKLEDKLRTYGV